jgi:hypothetical protein
MTSVLYISVGLQNTHIKEAIRDLGFMINDNTTNITNFDNRVTVLEAIEIPDYSNDIANINVTELILMITWHLYYLF